MSTAEIRGEVRKLISGYIDQEISCGDNDDLLEVGLPLDSMGLMGLVVEVERHFDVTIEDDYLNARYLGSIAAIATLVEHHSKPRRSDGNRQRHAY